MRGITLFGVSFCDDRDRLDPKWFIVLLPYSVALLPKSVLFLKCEFLSVNYFAIMRIGLDSIHIVVSHEGVSDR